MIKIQTNEPMLSIIVILDWEFNYFFSFSLFQKANKSCNGSYAVIAANNTECVEAIDAIDEVNLMLFITVWSFTSLIWA